MNTPYDPEKYREKREKVLGIKRRGFGFGTLAGLAALVIITGMGAVTLPDAVSYLSRRHLDDAIFKLESGLVWPDPILESLGAVDGITALVMDNSGARLVVTYDRRKVTLSLINSRFDRHDLKATLLNRISHLQHRAVMEKEEAENEAS